MDEYKKYEPIFGSWYLGRLLGKGSFGKVFEITREEFGTTYRAALKIITVPQDDDDVKSRMSAGTDIASVSEYYEGILKEIINENEIMAQLKGNSNIVSYEDHQIIPHDDGIGYDILIRMELLTPLLDRMIERKLDESEVVKLGIDMCKALETCHKKNIIHRDIKPQNIFISDNGDFKLGDFGIARTMEKTTGGMSKKGTYKYMAPEVFMGANYDATVDIYSLGIVLYSLLNGNRGPFLPAPPAKVTHNDEEEARMRRFRGEPIPAPRDAGPMLAYIIQKASAADPGMRYQTAEQMRRDLESYQSNYNGTAAQAFMPYSGAAATDPMRQYTGQYSAPTEPMRQYTGQYNAPTEPMRQYTGQYGAVPYMQSNADLTAAPANSAAEKKGGPKWIVIVAAVLIVAAIAALAAVLLGGKGGDGTEADTGSDVPEADMAVIADATEYNGHHYQVFDEPMRWDQARDLCESNGGHLAIIEDVAEQSFIEDIIRESGEKRYHYWLGGTAEDGSWKWLNGELIPGPSDNWGYENWEKGKPNNNTEAAGYSGQEICLEIQTTNSGSDYMKWNDIDMDGIAIGYEKAPEYNSTQYFGYICEWDY